MTRLLFLLPALLSADLIQDLHKESFYQTFESDFTIITAFLVAFAIISLVYLFSLTRKNKYTRKHKIIIQTGDVINTVHSKIAKKDVDLLRILDGYLSILHQKAAKSNNKIYFNFNQHYPRYVQVVHEKLCVLVYTLAEFVLDHIKDSHIFIGIRPKKSSGEGMVRYEFYIKTDNQIPQLELGDISNTLETHGKMLEVLHKGKKELMNCVFFEFHKLKQARILAKILGTKVSFSRWQKHSMLSFELELPISKALCDIKNKYSSFFGLNTVILEDDICGFYQIASNLKQFSANIQPKMDLELAKEHLFNPIFTPSYVFINTRVLRKFSAKEIKDIEKNQENHGYQIILISDSTEYDEYDGSLKNYVLVKNPISIDTLLAAMSTPPPQLFKQN